MRRASFEQPIQQARSLRAARGSSYVVSDAGIGRGGLLPAALADAPSSPAPSLSSPLENQQVDDLLNSDSPAATFQQVYLLLKDMYVDRIDSDQPLAHGAASALLASLDEPNSRFLEQSERQAIEDQGNGLYQGIGAAFTVRKVTRVGGIADRQITIIDALPGSPAEKAGLKTGDVITGINGHWIITYDPFQEQAKQFKKLTNDPYDLSKAVDAVEKQITGGYSLDKAQTLLDTTAKEPLKLSVTRPGVAAPLALTVDADTPVQVKDIESHRLSDGNGYIAVNVFTNDTAKNFSDALSNLGNVNGLVVDLRDCAGGMIDPAVQIAKALVPSATFGEVVMRSGPSSSSTKTAAADFPKRMHQLDSSQGAAVNGIVFHKPISVLVNKGTANTAEMLAAFLHDQMGARIVGSGTFGDAMTQTLFPLTDGAAFTLTTGVLKTDRGISFQRTGLAPEYALADPGHPGVAGDAGLSKAVALLAMGETPADSHPLQAAAAPSLPGVDVAALPSASSPASLGSKGASPNTPKRGAADGGHAQ